MKKTSISSAVVIALASALALAGCKKHEETVVETTPPMTEPAPAAPVNEPMTPAEPAVTVSAVTVGNTAAADKAVMPMAMFSPKDKIIVSVKTEGAANDVKVDAKLSYQDGQVAGEQSAMLTTSGPETTNIEFSNPKGWPAGKYTADVMVDGKSVNMPHEFEVK
ncbi:hypothetical protein [Stenotrophomonas sp. YIM B06876]|uniref:hypothetical protein n=1 Tax=Stenotrophomonas sp. YIM B06876 TaxID=3060211 RepID=UPI00273A19BC|nr:hypothetical protein [Stenotrophomonas sp. YIM B06876]